MSFANPQYVLAVNVPPNDDGVVSGRIYTLAGRWACPQCHADGVGLEEFPCRGNTTAAWICNYCNATVPAESAPNRYEVFRSRFFVPINNPGLDVSDVGDREPVYVARGGR